ncbi:MAG: carotenoid biosynthesis protein, partial [Fimbriimonadaceae bacterium]
MGKLSRLGKVYLGLVAFSLAGSAVSRLTGLDPGPIAPVAAALTLLTGFAAAFAPVWQAIGPKRALAAGAFVLTVGAASEIAGLYTGLPFGRYAYTDAWFPTVPLPGGHFFPLLLPFAWFLMAGSAYLVVSRLAQGRDGTGSRPPLWVVPGGALLAAALDVPMEPVMTDVLGYWVWLDPTWPIGGPVLGAPLMNAVGWVATSL